ncbi:CvpA family protein [Buchnera aphidicola]|uniref:CvpA family protein n=1 Tax=Buchnera aphidicola TaxID=9 RepID=UPI0034647620
MFNRLFFFSIIFISFCFGLFRGCIKELISCFFYFFIIYFFINYFYFSSFYFKISKNFIEKKFFLMILIYFFLFILKFFLNYFFKNFFIIIGLSYLNIFLGGIFGLFRGVLLIFFLYFFIFYFDCLFHLSYLKNSLFTNFFLNIKDHLLLNI